MLLSIWDVYADLQQVPGQRGELHLLYGINADMLHDLINLLEPFDQATRLLSADTQPTVHLVQPTFVKLQRHLQPDPVDSELISSLKEKLLNKLYAKFSVHPLHEQATFLSPSVTRILEKAVTIERLSEICTEIKQMAASCHNPESESDTQNDAEIALQPPPMKRMRPDCESSTLFGDFFQDVLSDTTRTEVEPDTLPIDAEYSKITNMEENLLDFWKTNSQRFPLLSSVAKKLLSVSATSTPSERVFSAAGRIIEECPTQLAPDTVDNLLFIHSAR